VKDLISLGSTIGWCFTAIVSEVSVEILMLGDWNLKVGRHLALVRDNFKLTAIYLGVKKSEC
jgi:hypothetical protein